MPPAATRAGWGRGVGTLRLREPDDANSPKHHHRPLTVAEILDSDASVERDVARDLGNRGRCVRLRPLRGPDGNHGRDRGAGGRRGPARPGGMDRTAAGLRPRRCAVADGFRPPPAPPGSRTEGPDGVRGCRRSPWRTERGSTSGWLWTTRTAPRGPLIFDHGFAIRPAAARAGAQGRREMRDRSAAARPEPPPRRRFARRCSRPFHAPGVPQVIGEAAGGFERGFAAQSRGGS